MTGNCMKEFYGALFCFCISILQGFGVCHFFEQYPDYLQRQTSQTFSTVKSFFSFSVHVTNSMTLYIFIYKAFQHLDWNKKPQVILFEFTPNGAVTGTAGHLATNSICNYSFVRGVTFVSNKLISFAVVTFHRLLQGWLVYFFLERLESWGVHNSNADVFLHTFTSGI